MGRPQRTTPIDYDRYCVIMNRDLMKQLQRHCTIATLTCGKKVTTSSVISMLIEDALPVLQADDKAYLREVSADDAVPESTETEDGDADLVTDDSTIIDETPHSGEASDGE